AECARRRTIRSRRHASCAGRQRHDCHCVARSLQSGERSSNPVWGLHFWWVWNLSTCFWNVCLRDEPLGIDVSQFPMNRAGEMHCLLAEHDAPSAVGEVPIEDGQAALEPMRLATRVDDQPQGMSYDVQQFPNMACAPTARRSSDRTG